MCHSQKTHTKSHTHTHPSSVRVCVYALPYVQYSFGAKMSSMLCMRLPVYRPFYWAATGTFLSPNQKIIKCVVEKFGRYSVKLRKLISKLKAIKHVHAVINVAFSESIILLLSAQMWGYHYRIYAVCIRCGRLATTIVRSYDNDRHRDSLIIGAGTQILSENLCFWIRCQYNCELFRTNPANWSCNCK